MLKYKTKNYALHKNRTFVQFCETKKFQFDKHEYKV